MNLLNFKTRTRANLQLEGASDLGPGSAAKNLVMSQVKILKHGEQFNVSDFGHNDDIIMQIFSSPGSGGGHWNLQEFLVLCSIEELGLKLEAVQKQIKLPDLSAFFISPLPNSKFF
nr:uncharacterized protein LOC109191804 [Ipomoea batatas]